MAQSWHATALPVAGSRTDDIWFIDELVGWAVNSDGKVYRTSDGGASWLAQKMFASSYLRCVSFSSAQNGWLGMLSGPNRLHRTNDGGTTWSPVENLPIGGPRRICGLATVDDQTVFASGTNFPNEPAGVLRTTDGGGTWQALEIDGDPVLLVDIHFADAMTGWVVGGVDDVRHPDREIMRRDVVPGVFQTTDGGRNWKNLLSADAAAGVFPRGEWGWKIQHLGRDTLIVSCENVLDGAILRSDDRGASWTRRRINDQQRNSNLEGVGFLDSQRGWVGGWGDAFFTGGFTSETLDGGRSWTNANAVGFRLNRFRFIGDPVTVAYASGDTVYKFSEETTPMLTAAAEPMPDLVGTDSVAFDLDVPDHTAELQVRIWDRYGCEVAFLVDEVAPAPGSRRINWNFEGDDGALLPPGGYIVRAVMDSHSVSRVVLRLLDQPIQRSSP